jgi:hypothetical protein
MRLLMVLVALLCGCPGPEPLPPEECAPEAGCFWCYDAPLDCSWQSNDPECSEVPAACEANR